ncbi:YfhE family protein [Ornithinibacillus sp. L9]|uniref:YfhE family protein n=1 Tax=Ornithinibacillus caprae TaxID=2678566 RepID=A0A6N8FF65_9BACI|nr:YfhE family protein [Ornithinibacillus caprae]MUK88332.1 YfhE family protein [Ornithinibacillus caprae]
MANKPKDARVKHLSKTQEVLYQREFKQANRIYNELTQKGNRG